MYKRRNEIERLFRRLKGFRRIFSRFEKLDVMFIAFISFALIADGLRLVLTGPSVPRANANQRIARLVDDWSTAKRGIAKFPYETVGGEGGIRTRVRS